MVKQSRSPETSANTPQELSDEMLAEASGGFNPQPDPPKIATLQVVQPLISQGEIKFKMAMSGN